MTKAAKKMTVCPATGKDYAHLGDTGLALHIAKNAAQAPDKFTMMEMTNFAFDLATECMRVGSVEFDMVRQYIGAAQKEFGF